MLEIVITSSLLILIVIALRFLLRNKLSPIIIYALWAIVALRLLVPISLFDSRVSVMNLFERSESVQSTEFQSYQPTESTDIIHESQTESNNSQIVQNTPVYIENNADTEDTAGKTLSLRTIVLVVWLTGMAAVFGYTLSTNIRFSRLLKSTRRPLRGIHTPLQVYEVRNISSPCLYGVFRPSIYLTDYAADDRQCAGYVITHELMHYRHLDHIWAMVRVLCCAVYWFNPLVWLAAYLSRQDSELACDSAVVRQVGEEYRLAYGRTLVDMVSVGVAPSDLILTSTTMSSGSRSIKERISMIKKHPKTIIWAALVICVAVVAAFAVTFTGAANSTALDAAEAELPEYADYTILESNISGVEIRSDSDIAYLLSVLDIDGLENVSPEDIPARSKEKIIISFLYDHFVHFTITDDGYVIYHDMSGGNSLLDSENSAETITITTDNVASGKYFDGHYGFFHLSEMQYSQLTERLSAISERQQSVDTGKAEYELFPDLLAEYSTIYNPRNIGRAGNLELAADMIDGTVLQPGEEFSFNNVVGERTFERGFVHATGYSFESEDDDYGAGISQTATTLFNAAFMSGMEITEQHSHTHAVNYTNGSNGTACYGNDARVAWGTNDLRFTNSKGHPVMIRMNYADGVITASVFGTSDGVRVEFAFNELEMVPYSTVFKRPVVDSVDQSGQPGRTIDVYRVIYGDENEITSEFAYSVMYLPEMEVIYSEELPVGCEYDTEYMSSDFQWNDSGEKYVPDAIDQNEVWGNSGYQHLLKEIPMFDDAELIYCAYHPEGVRVTEQGHYNMVDMVPEIDLLVMVFNNVEPKERYNYIQKLRDAGFTYHADDGSGFDEYGLCVLYNAPSNGVGVQIEPSGNGAIVIFFPQRSGCFGLMEPVPKG